MARGTQHRKRRPRPNARSVAQPAPQPKRAKVKHASWEDQLFFSRLRVHAKWMFVLLALAFGVGFVIFGVGSGSTGISQAMQGLFSSSGGGSSLSSLQKKARDHPKDATAWRNLATKLEQGQKVDRAIVALQHYTRLAPKDASSLEELAGLYVRRAGDYYNLYAQVQAQSELVSPSSVFRPSQSSPFGKAFANQDPILAKQATIVSTKANAALQKLSLLNVQSEDAYKKLVKLSPQNATYQFQLGQVAFNLGDKKTATPAFTAFLKLAPNDSLAPRAKQALKQLSASSAKVSTIGAKKSGGR